MSFLFSFKFAQLILRYPLVDPDRAEEVLRSVKDQYLKEYPGLGGKYVGALCDSADGVKL